MMKQNVNVMKGLFLLAITLCMNGSMYAGFKIATGEPLRSQQQDLAVKGRMGIMIKQKLSFGDYRTTMVKRSAIRKWTGIDGFPGMIWTEHMQGRQSIHFRLTNGDDTSDVMAVSRVQARDLLIGTAEGTRRLPGSLVALFKSTEIAQNNYSVSIVNKRGEEPWELFLDNSEAQLRRKQPAGFVRRGDDYYTIEPVWHVVKKNGKVAEMPFGSAGFEIKDKDMNVMAAVSMIDNGEVYIGPGTEAEKLLFANVCAALLLQENINE